MIEINIYLITILHTNLDLTEVKAKFDLAKVLKVKGQGNRYSRA